MRPWPRGCGGPVLLRLWASCPQPFSMGWGTGVSLCSWARGEARHAVLTCRALSGSQASSPTRVAAWWWWRTCTRAPSSTGSATPRKSPRWPSATTPRCPPCGTLAGPELSCPCSPSGPTDRSLPADSTPPPPGPGLGLWPKRRCLLLPDPSLGRAPGLLPAAPLSPRHRRPGSGFLTRRQAPGHTGSAGRGGGRWPLSPCLS